MVSQYANQLKGLTLQQAELALSTKILTNEQKQQILAEAGLIATENTIQAELLQTTLAQAGLSAEKQKSLLIELGLMDAQSLELITQKACTKAKLEEQLALHGVTGAQAENIISTLGLSGANTTATVSFELLGASIKKATAALWAFLTTNPVGWAILAGTALTGVVLGINAYNKKQEELREEAEQSAQEIDNQSKSLDELKQKYIEICNSTDDEATKSQQLNDIKQELVDVYGFEKDALKELNDERERGLDLLDGEFEKKNRSSRNKWLEDNKDTINKANEEMASDGVDYFTAYLSKNNIASSILELFDKQEVFGDTGYVNLEFDYTDTADRLNKLKNIYNEILDIKSKRSLTADEQQLLSDVKTTLDSVQGVYDKYYDIYSKAAQYNVENIVENYLNTDEGKIENVGKDTFKSWSKGLLDQAENAEQKRQLETLIENQFPDLTKYFDNLETAKTMFVKGRFNAKPISDYLEKLSPEDLEIATKIPDLFADGLEGATAKIEAWKSDPKNKITADVDLEELQEAYDELSKSASSYVSNQKSITSALEEQKEYGQLSAKTIQDLIDAGYAQALVYDDVTGAMTLNQQTLELLNTLKKREIELDLQKQETDLVTIYDEERSKISELNKELANTNSLRAQEIINELTALEVTHKLTTEQLEQVRKLKESLNAPTFEDGKEEKPDSVVKFEAEYARRQHEINMGRMKEDEDYYKWLESAAKTAFEGLEDYQDELWKYEEEVYKGRKQLAEDYYNDRISDLEAQIDIATKYSTDKDGNPLDTQEKFDYIRSTYQEILSEIDRRRNEIIQAGVEGNEDVLKELEKQYEDYVREMADVFKDEVESEIDYIQDLQDTAEKAFDDKIDKIEAEKKAMEDRYDAEIDKIDSVIDSLEKENDQKQLALNIAKAEKELAEAQRKRNIGVLQANGTISYQADPEAITEAQNNLNELYLKRTTEALKQQKELLQKNKDIESDNYDAKINNLKTDKEKWKDFYDELVNTLNEYLNPKQKKSNTNVWNTVAGEDGAVKVGRVEMSTDQIDARISSDEIAKSLIEKFIKASNDEVKAKELIKNLDLNNAYNTLSGNSLKPAGLAELQKAGMFNSVSAQNYVNNNGQTVNLSIGDIYIQEPVGDTTNLAQEIIKRLPNAIERQLQRNR